MANSGKFELLAPAGDMEKLKSALHFGADAVYLGGENFGLRKASKNFSREELEEAVRYAHAKGTAIHVTTNILPHDNDLDGLKDYALFLESIGVDAVIVSDPGIFMAFRNNTQMEIHVSTQASITSSDTVNFWADLGAKRLVLARELSLKEIRKIRENSYDDVDLECFVHGAMCISYSGRCLLSNYMTGRDANQGDCAQACRWKYHLMEEKREGEFYPIGEDGGGTFILNSKDLCLLPYMSDLMDAGIRSFKIEGRVKTAYYVACVVKAYRQAIDAALEGKLDEGLVDDLMRELAKTSHRDFTSGFLFGNPGLGGQNYDTTSYIQDYDFIGLVKEVDEKGGRILVQCRNKFAEGDEVEMVRAKGHNLTFLISNIEDQEGSRQEEAKVPMEDFWIPLEESCQVGDMVRRRKN